MDLSLLPKLAKHQSQIITTYQVEMEFKKNRQKVILEAHKDLKHDGSNRQFPAFLTESKQSTALTQYENAIKRLAKKLQERTEKVLSNPTQADPIYKATQRIFNMTSDWNLNRDKKNRFPIRSLARKRFILGYPPRKNSDITIGDAVNWEWIIHCAKESTCGVVIVTRDSDYGELFCGKPILNDWLKQEFKQRVSRTRSIILTNRLSEGLKAGDIAVSRVEEKQEEEFLKNTPSPQIQIDKTILEAFNRMNLNTKIFGAEMKKVRFDLALESDEDN